MTLAIGFDVGTQGTKGVVVDAETACVLAKSSSSYGLLEGLASGAAEQHPETWIAAVRIVTAELLADPAVDAKSIAAVGVSGQQHGLVVLDEQDRVLRPAKLWCDTSSAAEARELSMRLGRSVPTGFTASKILWLARHEADNWARCRSVLLPHDYINFRLTGTRCMEAGDASGTGFFDAVAREFDPEALAAIDPVLAERLPPLIAPDAGAGRVSRTAAEDLGLPEGIVVSAGGGDNMMSAIGSGATREGVLVISLGTSGTAFGHSDTPVVDPEGLIAPFCGSAGGWLPLLCVMNLTGVTEEVRTAFGGDHAALTNTARAVPIGSDGLLWLPYLAGERVPDLPEATGTLLGMRAGLLRPGHLYRAAIEGTSLNLAWGIDRMRALGVRADEVRLVGGAARNPLWREVLANLLGAPVMPLREPESGALGAAIHALWCLRRSAGDAVTISELAAPFLSSSLGPTLPDSKGQVAYSELRQKFSDAVKSMN